MDIAIVGTGVSGLVCAHLLADEHQITVFEAGTYVGGHTNTVDIPFGPRTYAVDTGFIVYNERTYPNFVKLLSRLGVTTQPSDMSFSVRCDRTGLEYCGSSLSKLFAQRRNLARVSFLKMISDILRFNRSARTILQGGGTPLTLAEFFEVERFSQQFIDYYIVPMMSAIWSKEPQRIGDLPAEHFLRFFDNHGLLDHKDHVSWRVVSGGSKRYVEKLIEPFRNDIRLNTPIQSITRYPTHVEVKGAGSDPQRFDQVIIATHSDQALRLITDATKAESEVLAAIPYQKNEAVLHTDTRLLPRRHSAWASWNYRLTGNGETRSTVTYNMNRLQNLDAQETFCVTLNQGGDIDPAKVLRRIEYEHPVFSAEGIAAQRRHAEISGVNRTHYCGAYWGYGFHEDGVNSALSVCRSFGSAL